MLNSYLNKVAFNRGYSNSCEAENKTIEKNILLPHQSSNEHLNLPYTSTTSTSHSTPTTYRRKHLYYSY